MGGAESGLYIYNLTNDKITHLTVPDQDDSYALSDNAIYSLCCDKENGMWIGSYFGGVNYCLISGLISRSSIRETISGISAVVYGKSVKVMMAPCG